jgi:hypothetical protein
VQGKTTASVFKDGRKIVTRRSTIEEQGDRSFDIEFWQQQTSEQRANAVWEMVVWDWEMKGKNPDELRLQRSVEHIQRNGS